MSKALRLFTIAVSLVLFTNTAFADCGCHRVLKNANVRSIPSMQGKVVDILEKDMEVVVEEKKGDWCKIAYTDNTQGYVYCPLLEPTEDEHTDESFHYTGDNSDDWSAHADDYYDDYNNSDDWNTHADDYYDDYSSDDYSDDYYYDDLPYSAYDEEPCDPQVEICSLTFNASINGNIVSRYEGNVDVNIHVNGAVDYLDGEMAININGSGMSGEQGIMGSVQTIILPNGAYARFENMQATGMSEEPFPIPQNQWLKSPSTGMFMLPHRAPGTGDIADLQEMLPNSIFVGQETINGKTRFHYRVNHADLRALGLEDVLMGTLHEMDTSEMLQLDYWTTENNILSEIHGKLNVPMDDELSGGTLEFSLAVDLNNPKVTLEAPKDAIEFDGDLDNALPMSFL